ncbi:uncharacterized protein LOC113275720 [Papaver somniferum]|uniref:uncharacterized protein LOC113275720 n=1 Tax=Papaver somniferum TaxID=3469 RepID=UPI000E6FBD46|nr:uncharacterized protein LOC113275720 [Papaver somniferum]XP_026381051.1 uncharacterized protein LOC113275720 [Papaver somniferum]XP_026381052.1 uncharacterized protein LOC113275720 [Papaver somniferum]XP_026381053.1 uncharacterized protein LOC113275720 [Papaver somniferum]XP_026381054.1 uncharacterized protein LOC113275720 [Papaver somniferum]XP_026381055.1 uncharacterized protein LOC113275720 [Papaver somniferum]
MEKEIPTGAIYNPDVCLKTHRVTPDDNPSSSKSLAAAELVKVQEEKHNLRKEKQKNEALKAQLDAERQKNKTGVHYQISNSFYQQDIVFPSSFGLCCLRNFRKKVVALAYVDSKLLIDDRYECMIEEIFDPRAMFCNKDDAVLRDVSRGEFIKCPKAYVTSVGE